MHRCHATGASPTTGSCGAEDADRRTEAGPRVWSSASSRCKTGANHHHRGRPLVARIRARRCRRGRWRGFVRDDRRPDPASGPWAVSSARWTQLRVYWSSGIRPRRPTRWPTSPAPQRHWLPAEPPSPGSTWRVLTLLKWPSLAISGIARCSAWVSSMVTAAINWRSSPTATTPTWPRSRAKPGVLAHYCAAVTTSSLRVLGGASLNSTLCLDMATCRPPWL